MNVFKLNSLGRRTCINFDEGIDMIYEIIKAKIWQVIEFQFLNN
jgi:hypothetical protein